MVRANRHDKKFSSRRYLNCSPSGIHCKPVACSIFFVFVDSAFFWQRVANEDGVKWCLFADS